MNHGTQEQQSSGLFTSALYFKDQNSCNISKFTRQDSPLSPNDWVDTKRLFNPMWDWSTRTTTRIQVTNQRRAVAKQRRKVAFVTTAYWCVPNEPDNTATPARTLVDKFLAFAYSSSRASFYLSCSIEPFAPYSRYGKDPLFRDLCC